MKLTLKFNLIFLLVFGLGLAATTLYANSCTTVMESRYNARRGYWYQVPVTYC